MAKIQHPTWLQRVLAMVLILTALHSNSSAAPADLDPEFSTGTGPSARVYHVVALPGDKAFIAGEFTSYNDTPRRFLARLQSNGALDTSFDAGMGPGEGNVQCLAPLPDGKVLVGGRFSSFAGVNQPLLVRLNIDGSVDQNFDAQLQPTLPADGGLGLVKVQSDGKILISGVFQFEGETEYRGLARLHSDGSLDQSFKPNFAIIYVDDFVQLTDGRIVVSGYFKNNDGIELKRVVGLQPDGVLDPSYLPIVSSMSAYLAVQPDGKVLTAGIGGFKRLNRDGSTDASFATSNTINSGSPRMLTLQPDGRIVAGGSFYNGVQVAMQGVIRLEPDGSLSTFGVENSAITGVESISVDSMGRVLVAGYFTAVNGVSQPYLARLRGGELPFDGAGRFSFSSTSYLVNEANGPAQIVVRRTIGNQLSATVDYALTSGSASTEDFVIASGTLVFAAGENSKTIPVPLTNDLIVEPDETFTVKLSSPTGGATIWTEDTATVSIIDDDKPGRLEWRPVASEVFENAGSAGFVVTRNGETSGSISVNYVTVAGTASGGGDYTVTGGTLAFGDGENTKSVSVPIIDDLTSEGIETFALQLSNPTGGAVLGTGATASVSIVDNEMPGAIVPEFVVDPVSSSNRFRAVKKLENGQILVAGGGFVLRRLNPNGSNDSTFAPQFPEGAFVDQIVVQSDGRIILRGGNVRNVAGQPKDIVRLNADGDEDSTFNLGPLNGFIAAMALQPDDHLVVLGNFTTIGGGARNNMARLAPEGLLDENFKVVGATTNADVIAIQADGKILVGGDFSSFGGAFTAGLVRLHPGGELDAEFALDSSMNSASRIRAVAVQPNGRILAAGRFVFQGGGGVRTLVRLLPDGTLDPSFDAGTQPSGSSLEATFVLIQPDGKIVADGFPRYTQGGILISGVERRLLNGSLDSSFAPVGYRSGSPAELLDDGDFIFSTIEPDSSRGLIRVKGGDIVVAADGEFAFAWSGYEVNENAGYAVTHVLRKNGSSGSASISYGTDDGTAFAGRDYTSQSGILTFAPGETAKAIRVPVTNTTAIDGTRTFSIRLSRNLLNVPPIGWPSETTVAIKDDERPGRLQFEAQSFSVREGSSINVKVKRTLGSEGQVSVNCLVTPQTASSGSDYVLSNGPLVFSPGELEKSFTIQSPADGALEGAETFLIHLGGELGGVELGPPSTASVTIFDNEDGGSVVGFTTLDPDASISTVAKQADGKVIIAGFFDGFPDRSLIRLMPDGTLDEGFNSSVVGVIKSVAVQSDEKIVLAGANLRFSDESTTIARAALRLLADGSRDDTYSSITAAEGTVNAVGVQPDGKIILAGDFTAVGGNTRPYIARLLADGSFDAAFQPTVNNAVQHMVVASDGGILFALFPNKVARLHPDGTADPTYVAAFNGRVSLTTMSVRRIFLDRHDRLMVGGYFNVVNNQPRINVARLLPNGQLDSSFDAGDIFTAAPDAITVQDDGRILLASYFFNARGGVVRLFEDGVFDLTFAPLPVASADWAHLGNIVVLNELGVLVEGGFKVIDGTPRDGCAVLRLGWLPGAFQFSSGKTVEATEAEGNLNITIIRAGGSDGSAMVNYQTEPGSALEGSDFIATSGTLVFAHGEHSKSITIPIVGNFVHEEPKHFFVRLSSPEGAFLWNVDKTTQVNLADDDPPLYGALQFATSSISVNEDAGTVSLTIERVNGSEKTVSVAYNTVPGTAKEGADFVAQSGAVTFPDGVTSRIVEIPILGGDLAESAEQFSVVLSQPGMGASLGSPASVTITITDEDTGTLDSYRGTYSGLFLGGDSLLEGRITVTVGAKGAASGVIVIGKEKYSFRGQIDADGTLSVSILKKGLEVLRLTLQLDVLSPETEQITGLISLAGVDYEVFADRQTFYGKDNAAAAAGRYAVAFERGTGAELPAGGGFASMTVTKGGVVRMTGRLADGVVFSVSSFVTKNNKVPLYASLYGKSGGLFGAMQLTGGTHWVCSGTPTWIKPAREKDRYYPGGFAGSTVIAGSSAPAKEFAPAVSWELKITLSGGGLDSTIGPVAMERRSGNVLRGPEGLKLAINPANGLVTGGFKHPQTQRQTPIRGIFLPAQNRGAGYFLDTQSGGAFQLEVILSESP